MKILSIKYALALVHLLTLATAIRADLNCAEKPRPYSKGNLADSRACAQAMMKDFPFQSDVGTFHRWAKEDLYQLPRYANYDECTVIIDIAPDTTFQSSWTAIWGLASTLNLGCSQYLNTLGMLYTGGKISSGIIVSMGKTGTLGSAVGNATDLILGIGNATDLATE